MKDFEKLEKFVKLVEKRLEKGHDEYGDNEFMNRDLTKEIEEEIVDICAWSFLLWVKLQRLELERKYVFTCNNHDCVCHKTGIGISFTTDNIKEAEKHSRENNSPMWICKKEDVR